MLEGNSWSEHHVTRPSFDTDWLMCVWGRLFKVHFVVFEPIVSRKPEKQWILSVCSILLF